MSAPTTQPTSRPAQVAQTQPSQEQTLSPTTQPAASSNLREMAKPDAANAKPAFTPEQEAYVQRRIQEGVRQAEARAAGQVPSELRELLQRAQVANSDQLAQRLNALPTEELRRQEISRWVPSQYQGLVAAALQQGRDRVKEEAAQTARQYLHNKSSTKDVLAAINAEAKQEQSGPTMGKRYMEAKFKAEKEALEGALDLERKKSTHKEREKLRDQLKASQEQRKKYMEQRGDYREACQAEKQEHDREARQEAQGAAQDMARDLLQRVPIGGWR